MRSRKKGFERTEQERQSRSFGLRIALQMKLHKDHDLALTNSQWERFLTSQDIKDYQKCRDWKWDEFCFWIA